MSHPKIVIRYVIFVVGLLLMGLGVSLITKSSLGTSPISSVPYVLSMVYPITLGQLTFLLGLLFFLAQIIILGKDFPKEQILQLFVGPFFGFFIDFGMNIFGFVHPDFYVEKIIILLLGCLILALGVYLQVAAGVIVNPGEGIVRTIADKTGREFGIIKISFDSTLVFIAVVLSLCTFGQIKGLREGTIISAILVGYITKIFSAFFKHFNFEKIIG
jgi:uncharacterized protein